MNNAKTKYISGQAMTEYLVVATLGAMALIWSSLGDPSPIDQLLDAIKGFYKAFSYAMSLSV